MLAQPWFSSVLQTLSIDGAQASSAAHVSTAAAANNVLIRLLPSKTLPLKSSMTSTNSLRR
jgi:hypothetical protein